MLLVNSEILDISKKKKKGPQTRNPNYRGLTVFLECKNSRGRPFGSAWASVRASWRLVQNRREAFAISKPCATGLTQTSCPSSQTETDGDPCSESPCLEGATCTSVNGTTTYRCTSPRWKHAHTPNVIPSFKHTHNSLKTSPVNWWFTTSATRGLAQHGLYDSQSFRLINTSTHGYGNVIADLL